MNGKTGWFCYAKKSGCDILDKKMKSKNVSLVLKFIPVRGRKLGRTSSEDEVQR